MGTRFIAGLRKAVEGYDAIVGDVRGKGLLIAIEFITNELGFELGKQMLKRGVLVSGTLVNARTIRFEPPLTITEDQIAYVCKALGESLEAMSSKTVIA